MNNSEGQIGAPIANFRSNYFALYLQDTWKVTPKLSVNWGIRWENDEPFQDKHDAIVILSSVGTTPFSRPSFASGKEILLKAIRLILCRQRSNMYAMGASAIE